VVGETRGRRRALAGGDGAVVGEWHARESEEVETRWDFRFNLLAVNALCFFGTYLHAGSSWTVQIVDPGEANPVL
jgi:hypothetical protein